jgi:hypothetical protein
LVSKHTDYHDQAIALVQNVLHDLGWRREYFNAGVMVVSRSNRQLFDTMDPDLEVWLRECARRSEGKTFYAQTYLNFKVQELKVPLFDIGYKYNHTLAPGCSHKRFSNYIIHCKGHLRGRKLDEVKRTRYVLDHPWLRTCFASVPALTGIYDKLVQAWL